MAAECGLWRNFDVSLRNQLLLGLNVLWVYLSRSPLRSTVFFKPRSRLPDFRTRSAPFSAPRAQLRWGPLLPLPMALELYIGHITGKSWSGPIHLRFWVSICPVRRWPLTGPSGPMVVAPTWHWQDADAIAFIAKCRSMSNSNSLSRPFRIHGHLFGFGAIRVT